MGLGRDGTLHGTYESRSCLFPLGRPVSRKACKKQKTKKTSIIVINDCFNTTSYLASSTPFCMRPPVTSPPGILKSVSGFSNDFFYGDTWEINPWEGQALQFV